MARLGALMVVIGLVGCVGGGNGGGTAPSTNAEVYCQGYANLCAFDNDVQECRDACLGVADPGEEESCWFRSCAVAVGFCDNEHAGDPEILLCADQQGWRDACAELADACTDCQDASWVSMCEDTIAADVAADCINLDRMLFDLATRC